MCKNDIAMPVSETAARVGNSSASTGAVAEAERGKSTNQFATTVPLIVDLDGTLIKTDLLLESLLALLMQKPRCVFVLPLWRLKGMAYLKQQIARRVSLDVSVLPYRKEVLDYLRAQRTRGRLIVLATAADIQI